MGIPELIVILAVLTPFVVVPVALVLILRKLRRPSHAEETRDVVVGGRSPHRH